MTAAHESGHPVLASYAYKSTGLNNYSWVHKGSAKGFSISGGHKTASAGEKGYEIIKGDLMKYYPEYDFDFSKIKSVEYDIKSLIWLSRVEIGE
ncbi:hypothetical protein [Cricetibacter osteomyelitidis]|uniref:hypothetical protein n=1 Tax=Cricetibacter osteomyelitidis TaxID=1521931 RepID=UPI00104A572B|nr:hypothetical protein [Cricetibacter osteomyelitidis]